MKEETIHFHFLLDESRFSEMCTTMELKELNWLCKHMKNVRSCQPCISMNVCTEFSKAHVLPCEYRETYNFFQETPFGKFQVIWPCRTSFTVFIENASKSNWIQPSGLQNWHPEKNSELLTSLFWNLRCIPIHLYRLDRVPLTVKDDVPKLID